MGRVQGATKQKYYVQGWNKNRPPAQVRKRRLDLGNPLVVNPSSVIGSFESLQKIIDVIPSPVFVKDREHRWLLLNDSMCKFIGLPPEQLIGKSDYDLVPPEQAEVFWKIDDHVFTTGEENENEEEHTDLSGKVRTIITRKRRVHVGDSVPLLVAVITDITAFREAEAHSRFLAFHDPLSGLANRTLLTERVEQELARMARGSHTCALLYIDLDRFKEVNDRHGHPAGDELIREFANRLTALVRTNDTVARIGGDEFAILISDLEDSTALPDLCERILEAARQPFEVAGMRAFVDASIGAVIADKFDIRCMDLLRKADVALYKAKTGGRGCFRLFSDEMDRHRRIRSLIEGELREALSTGRGLTLYYQPLYSNDEEQLVGVEALVRWEHPDLGMLSPAQFLPVAEETGLVVPLGYWVIAEACRTIAQWPDIPIAVNLSPVQLRNADLADRVLAIVHDCNLDPARLQLEITESAILNADPAVTASLRKLRSAGVKIALDDFGTGYSSLTHLRNLDVDKVKIDKSFVQFLGQSVDSNVIVQAVANIGQSLGLMVTAEGVETKEQRLFLSATGCTELQGYLFSKPLTETALVELLGGKSAARKVA
jgi:diguanylate cyclase (GGDEF)-like protein/PAS domain S-box-containing protein